MVLGKVSYGLEINFIAIGEFGVMIQINQH